MPYDLNSLFKSLEGQNAFLEPNSPSKDWANVISGLIDDITGNVVVGILLEELNIEFNKFCLVIVGEWFVVEGMVGEYLVVEVLVIEGLVVEGLVIEG